MTSDAVENLDPRSVVNFMIEYGKVRDYKLKNVSLQKLLYFCHAAYLVRHGKPLVSGYFEAWEYGPVHRTVYDALRQYGRQEVTKPIDRRDPFTGQVSVISPPHNIVRGRYHAHLTSKGIPTIDRLCYFLSAVLS